MAFTVKGFTTKGGNFDKLYDKDVVLQNFLAELQSEKYSCDWDVEFGSKVPTAVFSKLTASLITELEEDIRKVANNQSGMELLNISTIEGDRSLTFTLTIRFLFDNNPDTNTISYDYTYNYND